MKKKILISLLVVILLLLTACVNNKESKNTNNTTNNNETKQNNNSVVVYFSATGNTEKIAKRIAKLSKSDIIEIIPQDKYEKKDLDYNSDCRANREQNDSKARPKIKNKIDINKYDTIYLGYPIWWGTNPKIILTLLDTYDFTDKTIIPFCTSGSTDISGSVNDLRNYNNKLNIKDGKRFSIDDSDKTLKEFINQS